ncbi:hypothetical protein GA0116948_11494 [Chitinophaga costaii]|uniref:Uncharacterized protein n=1 Tax=Chitinophaga costaii TaxID=1335309 RepID=A0A1C4FIE5_9BACT|nr:hypothetical protein GA0116948_11494 [Chitinophaga costaii]
MADDRFSNDRILEIMVTAFVFLTLLLLYVKILFF